MVRRSTAYEPRAPAQSVLYQIVRDHFETFRAQAGRICDGEGLPRFIEEEFEGFLRCGSSRAASRAFGVTAVAIPMIAIQMNAFAIADQVALVFNTVLNELSRGVEDEEDEEPEERADRAYWEGRVGKDILSVLDHLFEIVRQWDPKFELQYLKGRINVAKGGEAAKFVVFRAKRQWLRLETRLPQSEETDRQLEAAGLDLMPYKWNKYRVRLTKADASKHEALLTDLMRRAYESREQTTPTRLGSHPPALERLRVPAAKAGVSGHDSRRPCIQRL